MLFKNNIDLSIFEFTHTKISHADHSSQLNSFITTITDIEHFTSNITEVRSYSVNSLALLSSLKFDDYSLDNNANHQSEALFSFYDSSGLKSYIIVKSVDTSDSSNLKDKDFYIIEF